MNSFERTHSRRCFPELSELVRFRRCVCPSCMTLLTFAEVEEAHHRPHGRSCPVLELGDDEDEWAAACGRTRPSRVSASGEATLSRRKGRSCAPLRASAEAEARSAREASTERVRSSPMKSRTDALRALEEETREAAPSPSGPRARDAIRQACVRRANHAAPRFAIDRPNFCLAFSRRHPLGFESQSAARSAASARPGCWGRFRFGTTRGPEARWEDSMDPPGRLSMEDLGSRSSKFFEALAKDRPSCGL